MCGADYVALAGELYGMPRKQAQRRAHEVLTYLDLGDARYRKLEEYSTGMKQRLKLAQALVHDPPALLLDEPTSGMDPAGREGMLDLLVRLGKEHGKSILLSTHLLGDIDRVCDRGRDSCTKAGSCARGPSRTCAGAVRTVTACKFRAKPQGFWKSCALKGSSFCMTMAGAKCAWPCRPAGPRVLSSCWRTITRSWCAACKSMTRTWKSCSIA